MATETTQEEVLLKITLENEDTEKEVDTLTRSVIDLTKANATLMKQQKELIKNGQESSDEFVENSKQIEINKQKITQANATRANLIRTLDLEQDSIKALRIQNAELIKQRDELSTKTAAGRKAIKEINDQLDENNKAIKENVSGLEKQKMDVGAYTDALDKLVPGLGSTINGIKGMTTAALTFLATPLGAVLGAIGLALAAVTAYFKGSEEGQNKWNKVVAIGSAILEQFMNVVEDLGGAIVAAFENPKQAVIDLWETIKSQFVNRITGLFELLPKLGEALDAAFSGDFVRAAEIAADATGKVILGVENLSDKIRGLAEETAEMVRRGIENGERIAALNAQIDRDERELVVNRAKTALEVAQLREKALQQEGQARKDILLEAIALEKQLTEQEVALSRTRLALAQAELEANGDDKEAKKAVADATAAVINAETTQFQNTLRFRKEIRAIDEQMEKERLARLKRIHDAEVAMGEEELKRAAEAADTVEERVQLEIALEQFKTQELLKNTELLAEEREAIVQASTNRIVDIEKKGNADIIAEQASLQQALTDARQAGIDQELAGKQQILDNFIDQAGVTEELLQQQADLAKLRIDERIKYEQESEQNKVIAQLANEELTETQRQTILETSQAKQNAIVAKGESDRYKITADTDKKIADMKAKNREAEVQGQFMVANAALALMKQVFGESKALAAAQAILNTAQGITNALAQSGPPWVGIAMSIIVGALGAAQIAKIAGVQFAKGGLLLGKLFARGGVARSGGMLSGPSHAQGGIPFSVGGRLGFEAEGGEAIINKRSSKMFRSELSAINQAGGGVAFARGGIAAAGGMIAASQTSKAAARAEADTQTRDSIRSVMESFPPIVVTVEDINARTQEYDSTVTQAQVI